jgi:hypothetical protein
VRKQRSNKREEETDNGIQYKLIHYPSGINSFLLWFFFCNLFIGHEETVKVKIKGPIIFANTYKLNQPQLAVQFFPNNSSTSIKINGMQDEFIFSSDAFKEGKSTFVRCLNGDRIYIYY